MRKKEKGWLPEGISTSLNLLTFCQNHKAADSNHFDSFEKLIKAMDSLPRNTHTHTFNLKSLQNVLEHPWML